jgi:glycosyltransferase involved in cell wall biosynthesis
MKVALVYDRVNKIGGAERVLLALHEIFPEAPLYTAVYNPQTAPWAKAFKVIPSFMQKIPFAKTHHELFPWLTPLAFESFDFSSFDIVISITSAEAKSIITGPKTFHLCYCLTPTRYLWSGSRDYKVPVFLKPLISHLRLSDQITAQRPDRYLAISKTVARRIKKYYHQSAEVIYPGVDTKKWRLIKKNINSKPYYLVVSRLVAYKKIDLVVKAFNQLRNKVVIVGIGNELPKLKEMANQKYVKFAGQLTDAELLTYYNNCVAVIFPQEEDFGLIPLEAQACGKPVIAYRGGGALETVIEGKTGEFFYPQTTDALVEIIKRSVILKYKAQDCRKQAQRFDLEIFKRKFRKFVSLRLDEYRKNY